MKKIFIISLILCGFSTAYAQHEDLIDRVTELINATNQSQKNLKDLQRKIKALQADAASVTTSKLEKKNLDAQLKSKSDSIDSLKSVISQKDSLISEEKSKGEQKKEQGKNEALTTIADAYKQIFDDLLLSSTKMSVQRDLQLVGNNAEVKTVLLDLEKYFGAKELLENKFDETQIKNAQNQLNQIKQKSVLLDKLKENIEYYQDYNNALKETIGKLVDLDKRKAAGGDTEIQKLKFNEIVSELTDYMYNYYEYGNYPYLSDIVLEIIKRKKPDADADITDLLNKL